MVADRLGDAVTNTRTPVVSEASTKHKNFANETLSSTTTRASPCKSPSPTDNDEGMGQIDDTSFRHLVLEHGPAVGNYLRRRLYPLAAGELDDLVEETFIVVWRRRDAIPVGAELPWMIGVARNVLRNARRSRQRRDVLESSLRTNASDASAEDYVVADASVREALAQMNDGDREILMLNAWDGLDVVAIAATLSVTTNVAAVRLNRAQSRFRGFLAALEVV